MTHSEAGAHVEGRVGKAVVAIMDHALEIAQLGDGTIHQTVIGKATTSLLDAGRCHGAEYEAFLARKKRMRYMPSKEKGTQKSERMERREWYDVKDTVPRWE